MDTLTVILALFAPRQDGVINREKVYYQHLFEKFCAIIKSDEGLSWKSAWAFATFVSWFVQKVFISVCKCVACWLLRKRQGFVTCSCPTRQWGGNAWRTPRNVCVGGYTKLWVAMNVQELIQFHQSSGGGGQGAGARENRGLEGYRREREKN